MALIFLDCCALRRPTVTADPEIERGHERVEVYYDLDVTTKTQENWLFLTA
jgi:hypothetical protein